MPRRATVGASLEDLVALAIPLLQEAQGLCPRTGPGRKPQYDDWKVAVMILCAVLKKKKAKSAAYRFVVQNGSLLLRLLDLKRIPARSTFCDRYARVWPLVQVAIHLQGKRAIKQGVCNATVVAVDKSLVPARGPVWHQSDRRRDATPKPGIDREAAWGQSDYHGWVYGFSFEVVVTAPAKTSGKASFPLDASVDVASANERRTFPPKIPKLPPVTRYVLADSGYDGDDIADEVERVATKRDSPRGREARRACKKRWPRRRYICPPQNGDVGKYVQRGAREQRRQRRLARHTFLRGRTGRSLYSRRKQTIEPFNATLKRTFELEDHVWHRGLNNNQTQILMAIFAYQLLVRYHQKHGGTDAQVQYLLDGL